MNPWLKRIILVTLGGCLGCLALGLIGLFTLVTQYHNRIYPGITISQINVGGMTQDQAIQTLNTAINAYTTTWPIEFIDSDANQYALNLDPDAVVFDSTNPVNSAFLVGRKVSLESLNQLLSLLNHPPKLVLSAQINAHWLDSAVASIAAEVNVPIIPPQLEIVPKPNQKTIVQVNPGHNGQTLDEATLKQTISYSISQLQSPTRELPITLEINTVTADQISRTQTIAAKLLETSLELTFSPDNRPSTSRKWQLAGPDLIKFVRFDDSFDRELIAEYLQGVAESVNQPPKDAKFQFDEAAGKVVEFVPAENGITLDIKASEELLYQGLAGLSTDQPVSPIQLAFIPTSPDVSLSEVNRLGIKEKIGVGTSTYKGSIASRVHNVALGAARINGTLIKPGEEFSFNKAIGDISAATGYQAAYIIQNGRTELGDGGGVCQDSTTVFRAALDAGLPITNRRGHAYRVGYYEQDAKPGLDATVFSPTTDFKFLNDTPAHILVQAEADSANRRLTITLYGTSDGRKSEIIDHILWDVTPPPPDVYVDDPTLAPGQVKQIDWKAPGSKAKFTYRVIRNGEILQDKTFLTTYKPWAAVFLRGPQP